mgnify:CR=1 FL=1
MTIVFKPVVLPADLVGVKPGSLGPCLLRPLFFRHRVRVPGAQLGRQRHLRRFSVDSMRSPR